jgi:hypothetical protein
MLLSSLAHGGTGTVAQAVLLRQLSNTAKALHDAHLAAGEADRAAQIAAAVRERLADVRSGLPDLPVRQRPAVDAQAAEAARVARIGQEPAGAASAGSVLPNPLQPARSTQEARRGTSGRDRDVER